MLGQIWNLILVNPILNILTGMYLVTQNLAVSIILLTLLMKLVLLPLMIPAVKSMKKQKELKPELAKLKEKYKDDKAKFAQAQMELLKQHGINPATGCYTQILMLLVLIALYNVIGKFSHGGELVAINSSLYFDFLKFSAGQAINTKFFYMNLEKPDPYFVLAILSAIGQFIASKMMLPDVEKKEKIAEATPDKMDDIAYNMQQQSLYMMPIMNLVMGASLPAGIMLYILISTLFSVVQNYFTYGWGSLKPWINKLKSATNTPSHE